MGSTTSDLMFPAHLQGFFALPIIRKVVRKKKKRKQERFDQRVIDTLLDDEPTNEVVRRRGGAWVLFDDDTGVEVGSYSKRAAAWAAQRTRRVQRKIRTSQRKNTASKRKKAASFAKQRQRDILKLARKHKKNKALPTQKPTKEKGEKEKTSTKDEAFDLMLAQVLLNEAAPYVFEQSPTSRDSANWDNLIARISHETLQSDPKLKQILDGVHQTRLHALQKALKALKSTLQQTKQFEIASHRLERDADGDPALAFDVKMLRSNKKLPFSLVIQHNKPVLSIPDQTRDTLNSMASEDSKLLRAELMHTQETVFDDMHDVVKAANRRDSYLKSLETNLDKIVSSMVPVQIAMLKNLLKQKYKGMR